ncbi:peptidoglycan recognition protein family protein [Dermabacteraceae bacterium P7074]
MALSIDTSIRSHNYARGRGGRRIRHITIHYWGRWVGQSHEGIVEWLSKWRLRGRTSAHYVVSPGKVSQIVSEADTAWANGNRTANQESITIELCPDPARADATLATCAQLIAEIRARHGDLPLYPHKHWYNTDCPGLFSNRLGELDRMARGRVAGAARSVAAATAASKPATNLTAPPFPLPSGFYYGPRTGPARSVSGHVRNSRVPGDVIISRWNAWYSKGLKAWQERMKARGWKITPDGLYGPETERVVRQFQRNKRLVVGGKIGPATWAAAWSLPVK